MADDLLSFDEHLSTWEPLRPSSTPIAALDTERQFTDDPLTGDPLMGNPGVGIPPDACCST
jgi:hypothetical protein